jgi:hypothetical protein
MSDITFSAPISIFTLYLIISGNFTAQLLGCSVQRTLNESIYIKHLLGFMTMYFFVVLANSNFNLKTNPRILLLYTLLFYTIFILTTKMDFKWWIIFIIGLSIIYILEVNKSHQSTPNEEKQELEKYQTYLIYFVAVVILLGVLVYYGKKKAEFGSDFNNIIFFLGKTPTCAFNKPFEMSDIKAIQNVF